LHQVVADLLTLAGISLIQRIANAEEGAIMQTRFSSIGIFLLVAVAVGAQTPSERIRAEGLQHSQVMEIASQLTDQVGPRLTNSPGLRAAQANALALLQAWSVTGHLEEWSGFGRGWEVTRLDVEQLAPGYSPLIAYAKAWSPGTAGTVEGEPVCFDAADAAAVQSYSGKLAGRIVLFGPPRTFPAITPPGRWSDAALRELVVGPPPPPYQLTEAQRQQGALNAAKWKLLFAEHPAVVVEPGSGEGGTVYVTAAHAAEGKDPWARDAGYLPPQLVMAAEQYNRLVRLAAAHLSARTRIAIEVNFDASHAPANLVAELPGREKPDEVVMFGGPLDSWHTATGATDNGSGAAAALEAMRILATLKLPTRRTIRLALWSGEEQGRLGSRAWVAAHLGTIQSPKPDNAGIVAYFNLDWGPGSIRGIYLDGRIGEAVPLQPLLAGLADFGAATITPHSIGASDHVSFEEAGVPGFAFIRDFMEASGGPNHTNMDVYDQLLPGDLQQAAVVTATLVYELAQQTQPFPRH
jgi:carboxypeptidase Q